MNRFILATVALLAALVVGCTQQSRYTSVPTDPDNRPYRLEDEGQVPPLDRSQVRKEVDRIDVFEEMPVEKEKVSVEDFQVAPDSVAAEDAGGGAATGGAAAAGAAAAGGAAAVGGPTGVSPANPNTTKIDVFRVQVFASDDEATARAMSEEVAARLGQKVYVDHEGGMFKVRVGDCALREEAEKLRNMCQKAGYADAWIVMAPVIIPAERRWAPGAMGRRIRLGCGWLGGGR